jgi:hypothetical protein
MLHFSSAKYANQCKAQDKKVTGVWGTTPQKINLSDFPQKRFRYLKDQILIKPVNTDNNPILVSDFD